MFDLIFGSVSGLFHKWDSACIDNHIFRLHYRASVIILLASIAMVTPCVSPLQSGSNNKQCLGHFNSHWEPHQLHVRQVRETGREEDKGLILTLIIAASLGI